MNALKTFGRFWYDFIVGDDWKLAVGAVGSIAVVFFLTHHDVNAWWLLPLAVTALLSISLAFASAGSNAR